MWLRKKLIFYDYEYIFKSNKNVKLPHINIYDYIRNFKIKYNYMREGNKPEDLFMDINL